VSPFASLLSALQSVVPCRGAIWLFDSEHSPGWQAVEVEDRPLSNYERLFIAERLGLPSAGGAGTKSDTLTDFVGLLRIADCALAEADADVQVRALAVCVPGGTSRGPQAFVSLRGLAERPFSLAERHRLRRAGPALWASGLALTTAISDVAVGGPREVRTEAPLEQPLALGRGLSSEPLELLSPKERRVAELLSEGYTTLNAAAILGVSENTARTYVRRIYKKLDTCNRTALVRKLLCRQVSLASVAYGQDESSDA